MMMNSETEAFFDVIGLNKKSKMIKIVERKNVLKQLECTLKSLRRYGDYKPYIKCSTGDRVKIASYLIMPELVDMPTFMRLSNRSIKVTKE